MIRLLELPITELNRDKVYVYAYRSYKGYKPTNVVRTFLHYNLWHANTTVNGNRYKFNDSQLFHLLNHGKNYGHGDYSVYEIDNLEEVTEVREALDSMLELITWDIFIIDLINL